MLNYKTRLVRNHCQTAARVGSLALVRATAHQVPTTGAGVRSNVADSVTDAKAVNSVVEKFREKYGAKELRKYYWKFDVAVVELVHPTFRAAVVVDRATNRKAHAVQIS